MILNQEYFSHKFITFRCIGFVVVVVVGSTICWWRSLILLRKALLISFVFFFICYSQICVCVVGCHCHMIVTLNMYHLIWYFYLFWSHLRYYQQMTWILNFMLVNGVFEIAVFFDDDNELMNVHESVICHILFFSIEFFKKFHSILWQKIVHIVEKRFDQRKKKGFFLKIIKTNCNCHESITFNGKIRFLEDWCVFSQDYEMFVFYFFFLFIFSR